MPCWIWREKRFLRCLRTSLRQLPLRISNVAQLVLMQLLDLQFAACSTLRRSLVRHQQIRSAPQDKAQSGACWTQGRLCLSRLGPNRAVATQCLARHHHPLPPLSTRSEALVSLRTTGACQMQRSILRILVHEHRQVAMTLRQDISSQAYITN